MPPLDPKTGAKGVNTQESKLHGILAPSRPVLGGEGRGEGAESDGRNAVRGANKDKLPGPAAGIDPVIDGIGKSFKSFGFDLPNTFAGEI